MKKENKYTEYKFQNQQVGQVAHKYFTKLLNLTVIRLYEKNNKSATTSSNPALPVTQILQTHNNP